MTVDIFSSLTLGLVQGLTEFIPVSSSGHLILAREVFALEDDAHALAFDAVLQLATAFAILCYFRKDIAGLFKALLGKCYGRLMLPEERTLFLALALGTIPAVLAGLVLEDAMETAFRSSTLVSWMLVVGALLMAIADKMGKQGSALSIRRGFQIGLFQTLALVPGISRSGATISGGLLSGLSREAAARFSFLLGFPILFGSGIKMLYELWDGGLLAVEGFPLLVGSLAAFASGLLAIHFLVSYLKRHDMTLFVIYRLILASLILLSLILF